MERDNNNNKKQNKTSYSSYRPLSQRTGTAVEISSSMIVTIDFFHMNKRWSCLKPEQIQYAVIESLNLKNAFFAVKEGYLTEHLCAHSILLIAN